MNQETWEKIEKEFDERYYDKNTPSGLNQKYPFLNFIRMVDDIKSFIRQTLEEQEKEILEKGKEDLNFICYVFTKKPNSKLARDFRKIGLS